MRAQIRRIKMSFNKPERKVTILDDKKFSIYGNGGEKGNSRLFFSVTENGNPAIMVFPNDPNDPEKGPIRAAMDPVIWGVFVNTCRNVWTDSKFPNEVLVENMTGKPSAPFVDTITCIGRDDKGVAYLGVIKKGRPQKRFKILPTVYMNLVDREGNRVSDEKQSFYFAPGWLDSIDTHVRDLIKKNYKPYEKPGGNNNQGRPGGGFQGGGNRNQRQPTPSESSGGGYDFDDDVPF